MQCIFFNSKASYPYNYASPNDIISIFNPSTLNFTMNNAITSTLPCAVLCQYGSGLWSSAWGITKSIQHY